MTALEGVGVQLFVVRRLLAVNVTTTAEIPRVDDAHTRSVPAELAGENVERRTINVLQYFQHVPQRPPCQHNETILGLYISCYQSRSVVLSISINCFQLSFELNVS